MCRHNNVRDDVNYWMDGQLAGKDYSELFSPKKCYDCGERVRHKDADNTEEVYVRF